VEDKRNAPGPCVGCRFYPLELFICCRWRLAYAVNELKKTVPLIRRTAVENLTCSDYAPGIETETGEGRSQ